MKKLQNIETGDIWAFNEGEDVDALVRAGQLRDVFSPVIVPRPSRSHTWDAVSKDWVAPSPLAPKLTMMQRIKLLIGMV